MSFLVLQLSMVYVMAVEVDRNPKIWLKESKLI